MTSSDLTKTRGCATHVDMDRWSARSRRMRAVSNRAVDSGQRIYMRPRYVVLRASASDEPSLARMQAQHLAMNQALTGVNASLERVPTSGFYGYASQAGSPNIVLLPSNHEELTEDSIEVVTISSSDIRESDPLVSALEAAPAVTGVMNIYITTIPGNILGQAQVGGNILIVDSSTVGGPLAPGTSSVYFDGVTMIHEFGHAGNLPHTFDGCNNAETLARFPSIPPQYNPNPEFELYEESPGVWQGRLDNRALDCQVYNEGNTSGIPSQYQSYYDNSLPRSCFSCNLTGVGECTDCNTEMGEAAMDFMDYAEDVNSVMFFQDQADQMREWFFSDENTTVTLLDSDGGAIDTSAPESSSGSGSTAIIAVVISLALIAAIVALAFFL